MHSPCLLDFLFSNKTLMMMSVADRHHLHTFNKAQVKETWVQRGQDAETAQIYITTYLHTVVLSGISACRSS